MRATPTIAAAVLRVLHAPSVFAAYPAVLVEFDAPEDETLAAQRLQQALSDFGIPLGPADLSPFCRPGETPGSRHLLAGLAQWLDVRSNPERRPTLSLATSLRGGRSAVVASFVDQHRTSRILIGAISLARILLDRCREASPGSGIPQTRLAEISRLCDQASAPPDADKHHVMFVAQARKRGIPAQILSGTPRVLLLGQGCHGRLLHSTSNDRDSAVGTMLAADKSWSNALVERLGYPCVRHRIVHREEDAAGAIEAIGFPLVVKPVASGKGKGVFAGITSREECEAAIGVALRHSRRGVLVEAHVEGDDHRLAVFGGRLAWVVARRAASILGDGRSTIRALIERENARRDAIAQAERPLITAIDVDAELVSHLAKSGLTPEDIPEPGQRVSLRSIANVSRGGTYEDLSDRVHPDNRAMAESIAAAFRMDALGIDFLTTDISRSWRETGGAVIEVNETPGAGTPHYVDAILAAMFPEGSRARVPYVLFANAPGAKGAPRLIADARGRGHTVGFVSSSTTSVNGEVRGRPGQTLTDRVQSLLVDPRVSLIVAELSGPELEREGILLEQIDRAVIGPGCSATWRT